MPDDALTRTPPGGRLSVHEVLAEAVSEEAALASSIVGAIGAGVASA